MKRILFFTYGVVCYAIFFATFCYAVGFVGNLWVPKSIDSEPTTSAGTALAVNLLLLAVFAVQHSVMARPAFKRVWTRIVPRPIERSTYVLFTSLALILLVVFWQPMGLTIWNVASSGGRAILYGIFAFGWLLVLVSTFMINHFDLFGLRQVYLYLLGRPYKHIGFQTPALYKYIRHPLYVGWFLAFWATPTMTAAHLVFALGTTAYSLVAILFEERDLESFHGHPYRQYRSSVPMFIPRMAKFEASPSSKQETATAS